MSSRDKVCGIARARALGGQHDRDSQAGPATPVETSSAFPEQVQSRRHRIPARVTLAGLNIRRLHDWFTTHHQPDHGPSHWGESDDDTRRPLHPHPRRTQTLARVAQHAAAVRHETPPALPRLPAMPSPRGSDQLQRQRKTPGRPRNDEAPARAPLSGVSIHPRQLIREAAVVREGGVELFCTPRCAGSRKPLLAREVAGHGRATGESLHQDSWNCTAGST